MGCRKYLSMFEYVNKAERICSALKLRNPTEDEIGKVVNHMMRADKTFEEGKGATRDTYRFHWAKLGVFSCKSYRGLAVKKYKKNRRAITFSDLLNAEGDGNPIDRVAYNRVSTTDKILVNEIYEIAKAILSEEEYDIFIRYYTGEKPLSICNDRKIYRRIERITKNVRDYYAKH